MRRWAPRAAVVTPFIISRRAMMLMMWLPAEGEVRPDSQTHGADGKEEEKTIRDQADKNAVGVDGAADGVSPARSPFLFPLSLKVKGSQ